MLTSVILAPRVGPLFHVTLVSLHDSAPVVWYASYVPPPFCTVSAYTSKYATETLVLPPTRLDVSNFKMATFGAVGLPYTSTLP
jgi:hypothetical protein